MKDGYNKMNINYISYNRLLNLYDDLNNSKDINDLLLLLSIEEELKDRRFL